MEYVIILGIIFIVSVVFGTMSNNEKKKERNENLDKATSALSGFNATITVNGVDNLYRFLVDNNGKKICYLNGAITKIIPFDKIISVELIEDGTTISSKSTMRTVGGTLLGGALGGGAGAIVGGLSGNSKNIKRVKSVQVKIKVRDINNPSLLISCFEAATMTSNSDGIKPDGIEGYKYKQGLEHARKIADTISVIIDEVDKKTSSSNTSNINASVADELKKLADLKSQGILTQEEFDQQKAKLLSSPTSNNAIDFQEETLEDDLSPELRRLINEGRIIEAIKVYKDSTGVSLVEAKDFIDAHK